MDDNVMIMIQTVVKFKALMCYNLGINQLLIIAGFMLRKEKQEGYGCDDEDSVQLSSKPVDTQSYQTNQLNQGNWFNVIEDQFLENTEEVLFQEGNGVEILIEDIDGEDEQDPLGEACREQILIEIQRSSTSSIWSELINPVTSQPRVDSPDPDLPPKVEQQRLQVQVQEQLEYKTTIITVEDQGDAKEEKQMQPNNPPAQEQQREQNIIDDHSKNIEEQVFQEVEHKILVSETLAAEEVQSESEKSEKNEINSQEKLSEEQIPTNGSCPKCLIALITIFTFFIGMSFVSGFAASEYIMAGTAIMQAILSRLSFVKWMALIALIAVIIYQCQQQSVIPLIVNFAARPSKNSANNNTDTNEGTDKKTKKQN